MPEFDLNSITKKALGNVGLPFPEIEIPTGINPEASEVKTVEGSFNNSKNEFNGTDVFPVKLDGWEIPDEPTISISGGNNLVVTKLNRGDSIANVIEEVNMNNIEFSMKGTLYSDDDSYPTTLVNKLKSILTKGGVLAIECNLLTRFSVSQVVIKSWKISEGIGRETEQDYVIQFIQDTPIEIELINNV